MAAKDYRAYTLSVNDIQRAKVETGNRAIAIQILRLILLEPGTNPLFPGMGVGIVSLCRGKTEEDLEMISKEIETQKTIYLPKYQFAKTELSIDDNTNHTLVISIRINDEVYIYNTADTDTPIVLGNLNK